MAPKGAKRKFEPTEWTDIDVSGLFVQWKVTAAGMVHFKWEGSSKQTLTLTKDEDVQDAPRRVRARVKDDPAAKAAAVEAMAVARAAKAAAKAAAKTATREEPAEQAQTQSGSSVVFPEPGQGCSYYVNGLRYWNDECIACGTVREPHTLARCPTCHFLFCNVTCQRRGECPQHSRGYLEGEDYENSDDEAARDIGCTCACCQSRSPPFCYDCNQIPCMCALLVGPGKRFLHPMRDRYNGPGAPAGPTRHGGEELWNVRYASWLARRGVDPLSHEDVGVQPGYSPYGIYERMDGVSSSDVCSA